MVPSCCHHHYAPPNGTMDPHECYLTSLALSQDLKLHQEVHSVETTAAEPDACVYDAQPYEGSRCTALTCFGVTCVHYSLRGPSCIRRCRSKWRCNKRLRQPHSRHNTEERGYVYACLDSLQPAMCRVVVRTCVGCASAGYLQCRASDLWTGLKHSRRSFRF